MMKKEEAERFLYSVFWKINPAVYLKSLKTVLTFKLL